MKKQLLTLTTLLSIAQLNAYPVKATNSTDAAIKLRVTGLGKDETVVVPRGQTGVIDFGGICPWFAQILDAGELSNPPAPVEFNYSTMNQCVWKDLSVSRKDIYLNPSSGGQQTIVNTGTGSVNAPSATLQSRQFIVTSSTPGKSASGGQEVKEIRSTI